MRLHDWNVSSSIRDRQKKVRGLYMAMMVPADHSPVAAIGVGLRPDDELHTMAVGIEVAHVQIFIDAIETIRLDLIKYICSST